MRTGTATSVEHGSEMPGAGHRGPPEKEEDMRDNVWVRSSFCAADKPQCVEVSFTDIGPVFVKDSKSEDSPVLAFTRAEWTAFLAAVKAGEFDIAGEEGDVEIESVTKAVPQPA